MGSIDLGGSGMDTEGKIVLIGGTPAATITIGNGADNAPAVIKTGNAASSDGYQFTGTVPIGSNITIIGSEENKLAELTRFETDAAITGGTDDFVISSATEVTTP
jgi:hypothetical protein